MRARDKRTAIENVRCSELLSSKKKLKKPERGVATNLPLVSEGEGFDEFLNKLNPNKCDMYIMGDMNIDLLKCHSHQQTERYLDMIYSFDLLPVITKPTRITSHTATLIDHIYTNTVNRLTSGIVTVDISDHLPVFCMVDTPLKKQNRQNMYARDYSKFNTESYLNDIHTIDWI